MRSISLNQGEGSSCRILCLGAHCDDIEIGCGGAILKMIEDYPHLEVHWVVFSSGQARAQEALDSANAFLSGVNEKTIVVKNFRDGFFPYTGLEIKEYFEQIKRDFAPDIVFTHYRNDLHQDHRLISELTWNTFRDHLILEFEIPKYDGDLGSPNLFVPLSHTISHRKIQYIIDIFETQRDKQWFSQDTFLSILRLRGIEANSPTSYAEAFYCRKLVFDTERAP